MTSIAMPYDIGTPEAQLQIAEATTFDAEISASTGRLIHIGHVYDSEGHRLDQDKSGQRQELIRQYRKGISITDLGRERGASRQYISKVLRDVWHEVHGTVPP